MYDQVEPLMHEKLRLFATFHNGFLDIDKYSKLLYTKVPWALTAKRFFCEYKIHKKKNKQTLKIKKNFIKGPSAQTYQEKNYFIVSFEEKIHTQKR